MIIGRRIVFTRVEFNVLTFHAQNLLNINQCVITSESMSLNQFQDLSDILCEVIDFCDSPSPSSPCCQD